MNGQKNTRRTHTKSEKNIVSGGSEYNTHQICKIIFDGGYKRENRRHTEAFKSVCTLHIDTIAFTTAITIIKAISVSFSSLIQDVLLFHTSVGAA